jgi:N-acetylglutamate synthase-like GNAT family acetyltransferase
VRELTRAAYAEWAALVGREPKPMTADYDHAVREHIIDLYEESGELIALIEMIQQPDCLLVENISVRPDRHRQGPGDALLNHAENFARSAGLTELRLYTNAAFASNIAFYGRRGFDAFLREPIPDGGELVNMRKRFN